MQHAPRSVLTRCNCPNRRKEVTGLGSELDSASSTFESLDAWRSGTPFVCSIPLLFGAVISKMQIRVPKTAYLLNGSCRLMKLVHPFFVVQLYRDSSIRSPRGFTWTEHFPNDRMMNKKLGGPPHNVLLLPIPWHSEGIDCFLTWLLASSFSRLRILAVLCIRYPTSSCSALENENND